MIPNQQCDAARPNQADNGRAGCEAGVACGGENEFLAAIWQIVDLNV